MRSRRTLLSRVKPKLSILGLDASLNSSGYAYRDGEEVYTGVITPGKKRGCARLWHNLIQLGNILDAVQPQIMVIEGYAMNAKGNAIFQIGEWGGQARLAAWTRGIMIVTVTPGTLKQVVTGSGGPGKEKMTKAIAEDFGLLIGQSDEADAFGLLAVGEAMFLERGPAALRKRLSSKLASDKSGIAVEKGMGCIE